MAEIEGIVRATAAALYPGAVAHCCGSYRRMTPSSGDCDIIISHPDGRLRSLDSAWPPR